ncbi:ATP-dependent helicase [Kocuria massiliensis]|uniref:ATP-dependent helicase n=1 Tax=Kocuria massiliensis TaxID=1926282 RepID=UPI0022B95FAC|nr:ATP-dependent DNA helicase [Kocuria massiliensis]
MNDQKTAETSRYSPEDIARALGKPLPTQEQSEIISSDLSPRLIIAGAGSGKTATMVDRVVWLVVNGIVRPDEVLGVTFTKKAAAELRHRMTQRLAALREAGLYEPDSDADEPVLDPVVSTYHSYAKSLVSDYGLRIGVEKDATQLGQAQCYQLAAQIVENWDGELPAQVPAASTLVKAVIQMSGECAEHLKTPSEVEAYCEAELVRLRRMPNTHPKQLKKEEKLRSTLVEKLDHKLLVARLTERYRRVKEAMQVMDFGDLLAYAATMARRIDALGEEQRQLYRVVLLDEFQDTSHAQMVLFSSIFGAGHSVMAVGDPKQSIYGFRGASEGQLYDFYRYFPSDHPEASYLSVAWRNGTGILDAANEIARPLTVKGEWVRSEPTMSVPDLRPRPEAPDGRVVTGIWETDQAEAEAIVETIKSHRDDADRRGVDLPTAAVLCRARRHMETVRTECERQGIPYHLVGLGGLVETPEVTDVLATLRVLADPSRSDALMRLLAGARWRIGPKDAMALHDWARFLARRRERAVRQGIQEDLSTPEGQAPGEEGLQGSGSSEESSVEASKRLEELLKAGGDASDGSSLIEALETLPPEGWTSAAGRGLSETARGRLSRLQAELEELRGYLGEDLTSLVHHIERVTLVDIELTSKPGADYHQARANLDAFYEAVADYCATAPRLAASLDVGAQASSAEGGEDLVLPEAMEHRYTVTSSATGVTAFLAWLEAAVAEESGLPLPVGVGDTSAVQIVTVHGSKGLEWDEVYVQGMVEGGFPSHTADTWFSTAGALPWSLRGDAGYLPVLDLSAESTQELEEAGRRFAEHNLDRTVAEERRLAYVAVTRARNVVMLSSSRWSGTKAKPSAPSRFLLEVTGGDSAQGVPHESLAEVDEPDASDKNPQSGRIYAALWPFDPLSRPYVSEWASDEELNALTMTEDHGEGILDPGPVATRRRDVQRAADQVLSWLSGGPDENTSSSTLTEDDRAAAEDWDEETSLLLAMYRARDNEQSPGAVPQHVSASLLVGLAQDPDRVLDQLERPMPRRPETTARSGTRFHEWIEEHYGSSGMLDLGESSAEEDDETSESDLSELKERFRASGWYDRQPWAVEYPIETPVGGFTVRGRIDAVFRQEDEHGEARWELVDWKTGKVPYGAELRHKAVQLAVYRLGFSKLHGIDPARVSASFFYVAHGRTVVPPDIAGEDELVRILDRLKRAES